MRGNPSSRFLRSALFVMALGLAARSVRAQNLGPPDLAPMQSLQTTYGWGPVFGWPAGSNPCPFIGSNWPGVGCLNGRVDTIIADCAAVLLNQTVPSPIASLSAMREFDLRRCGVFGSVGGFQFPPQLIRLRLDQNAITGTLPVAQIPNLLLLNMSYNSLGGSLRTLPASCSSVTRMSFNRLSGFLPPEWIRFNRDISANMFEGPAPTSTTVNACPSAPAGSNLVLAYNKFDAPNGAENTQTVPPANVQVTSTTANDVTLTWTPILYTANGGYYEVLGSPVAGGPYVSLARTADKTASGTTVSGLASGLPYFFVVRTFTPGNPNNPSALTSRLSAEVSTTTAAAAPIVVTHTRDDGSAGSLRTAVASAPAGSTITFSDSTAGGATNFYDGRPHRITLAGTPIAVDQSLAIVGPGARLLSIGGDGASRVFTIGHANPAVDVTLADLTITGGQSSGEDGGGVRSESDGSLTVLRCTVRGNHVTGASGGGLAQVGDGALSIVRSTIDDDTATGAGANGGGVYVAGSGAVSVAASTFEDDTAAGDGGALAHAGTGALRIDASTLASNAAGGDGGAVASSAGAPVRLVNSTLTDDHATGDGGAVAITASAAVLVTNVTITANSAAHGGGLFIAAGTAHLGNDVLAGNSATIAGADVSGAIVTDGFNVFGASSGLLLDASDLEVADPMLAPLRFNGGPTRTMAPLPGSPVIDAGDSGIAMASDLYRVDQRGLPRFVSVFSYGGGFNRGSTDAGAVQSSGLSPAEAVVGVPYQGVIRLNGGVPPTNVKSSSAALAAPVTNLPPDIGASAVGSTVVFSGTPSTPGAFSTIGVTTNFASNIAENAPFRNVPGSFALTIYAGGPAVTTTSLPDGVPGAPYLATLAASGGNGNDTWSLDGGSLPPGLALEADGTITGVPTAVGTAAFTVRVDDSLPGGSATQPLSITIAVKCGDGIQSAGEACDDGNTVRGDGCSPDCEPESALDKAAQACVNGINKAGAGVVKAQKGLDLSCLKNGAAGKPGDPQTCLGADARGKVAKAQAATTKLAAQKCAAAPAFGFISPAATNGAAKSEGLAVASELFGADLSTAVIPKTANAAGAACQAAVLGTANKLFDTKVSVFRTCKLKGLSGQVPPQMLSASDLARCFGDVAASATNPKGKVARAIAKIGAAIAKACPGVTLGTAFPGACAARADLAACVDERIECRFCRMLDAIDGLRTDCDLFDDGSANASCS